MTVSGLSFSQQVDAWVQKTQKRTEAVFRESAQRLFSDAANMVPVDTGFARASVMASKADMPSLVPGKGPVRSRKDDEERGSLYPFSPGEVTAVIAGTKLGDKLFIGWTAYYAIYLEYGSSGQAPLGFVRVNAMRWPSIVDEVVAEAKARSR